MKDETLDAIYNALTTEQIGVFDVCDKGIREDVLGCICDFYNAGVPLHTAIDLAFNAFREE